LKPLQRAPLLYEAVQDAIRNYIRENNLHPGDPLPSETELASQLGVSRNSVREAVKALVSLGIVDSRRGSGLFVQDFSLAPLLDNLPYALMSDLARLSDLTEVRRVLEVGMIGAAMQALTDTDLHRLEHVIEQMRISAEKGEDLFQADRDFHQYLFNSLGNQVLLKLLDIFWLAFRKASQHAELTDIKPVSTYLDHLAILEAVKAQEVEAAQLALDRHYNSLHGRLERIQQERQSQ
jgi:DNA-binding FadR family transcriptional regulator